MTTVRARYTGDGETAHIWDVEPDDGPTLGYVAEIRTGGGAVAYQAAAATHVHGTDAYVGNHPDLARAMQAVVEWHRDCCGVIATGTVEL